jgi:hypothetical protein
MIYQPSSLFNLAKNEVAHKCVKNFEKINNLVDNLTVTTRLSVYYKVLHILQKIEMCFLRKRTRRSRYTVFYSSTIHKKMAHKIGVNKYYNYRLWKRSGFRISHIFNSFTARHLNCDISYIYECLLSLEGQSTLKQVLFDEYAEREKMKKRENRIRFTMNDIFYWNDVRKGIKIKKAMSYRKNHGLI